MRKKGSCFTQDYDKPSVWFSSIKVLRAYYVPFTKEITRAKGFNLQHNGIKIHTGKGSCKSGLLDPLAYVCEESCGIFLEDLENNLVPPHVLPNEFNCGAIMNWVDTISRPSGYCLFFEILSYLYLTV